MHEPKPNEYLIYDNLKQKISFSKKETNKCNNGCYLFVEVNCIEKLKDKIYYQGLNMDYSIYLKKYYKQNKLNYLASFLLDNLSYFMKHQKELLNKH